MMMVMVVVVSVPVVMFSMIVVVVSVPVVVFSVIVVVVLGMGVTAFARMFMFVLMFVLVFVLMLMLMSGDMFFFHSIAEFVSAKIPHPSRNPVANFSTL